uniref:D-lactate dehydrogenase (cytochrome) n=1 Tax=Acrobeloides nanus TaxID=290746 RepID=A0A914C2U0_9BILA
MFSHNLLRSVSSAVCKKCEGLVPKFEAIFGNEYVKTTESFRDHYGHDEGHFPNRPPDIVLMPGTVQEVSAAIRLCNEQRIPVIPYGTGTGLEGGVTAFKGGVCLDLKRMDQMTQLNEEDFDCVVQPGVTRKMLNEMLKNTGLWFTVDPGADASICGMIATQASGTCSVRYGTMKSNVKNLEVVLADGTILYTRGKNRRPWKSSAGYNLTDLFIGSEGTLGVITSACVNVHPRPPALSAAVCSFPDVARAVETVVNIRHMALPIARIEFLDEKQMQACIAHSKLNMEEKPTLFMEFHGANERDVEEQTALAEELCILNQGIRFEAATDTVGMNQLWQARHMAYYATMSQRKGARGFTTDVCVPLSQLPKVVTETRKDIDASGMYGTIVGHVGEGNFHCIFPVVEEDEKEMQIIWGLSDRLVKRALAVGGTCTGEHGIGLGKINYLKEELGEEGVHLMKLLKKTLDPNNILNPGKVLSE